MMREPVLRYVHTHVDRREVPDTVTGETWRCRVQARMPAIDPARGKGEWNEHVVCRHEGMMASFDLPLGELGRLTDEQLLERIVEALPKGSLRRVEGAGPPEAT